MKKISVYLIVMLLVNSAFAQKLNDKWDRMLENAENYQHYKVIKKADLAETWKAVQDSVNQVKADLAKEKTVIYSQEDKINQLDKQIADLSGKYETARNSKESISFLGLDVNKYTYTTILWALIAIIAGGAAVMFFLYNSSNKVTQQKIKEYEDLFANFEEFKKTTIEKERKLKREIQTQMNLIEELKSKPTRVM